VPWTIWSGGQAEDAGRILDRLLPPDDSGVQDRSGFVSPDLVRLFHGHALEQQAAVPGSDRQALLDRARADYLAVRRDAQIGRRAELSLAGNTYRRALGPAPSCKPGTVQARELEQASNDLRRLADDRDFTELGRLKATVNLAQVEQCRITAGLVADDGTVERSVATVRAAAGDGPVRELRALALSVAAVHAAGRGDLEQAVITIKAALELQPRFLQRGLSQGLLASWDLARCDLSGARQAQDEALRQLAEASSRGQGSEAANEEYRLAFEREEAAARIRCA
jgi:tetratricopeptide (TPR) repeat protein